MNKEDKKLVIENNNLSNEIKTLKENIKAVKKESKNRMYEYTFWDTLNEKISFQNFILFIGLVFYIITYIWFPHGTNIQVENYNNILNDPINQNLSDSLTTWAKVNCGDDPVYILFYDHQFINGSLNKVWNCNNGNGYTIMENN